MDEHALVAAARADPLRGFGVLYQRYADRIHDYCLAVLRHREDAADAAQDTFLIAYQRLGQLRDPGRLTPWLYAIARSRCLRRIAERRRQRPTEDLEPLGPVEPAATGKVESAELRQLVWDAAAGLADDDRAVLDLHLRQGLSGGELADALGVPAEKANLMLHRMKQRMGRTIGALLVARTARRDCPDLAAVTTGRLTPLVRKRLARHVERCRTCRAPASPRVIVVVPVTKLPLRADQPRQLQLDENGGRPRGVRLVEMRPNVDRASR
jgi:RNA polymerase sigma factor (sigma-70 family)